MQLALCCFVLLSGNSLLVGVTAAVIQKALNKWLLVGQIQRSEADSCKKKGHVEKVGFVLSLTTGTRLSHCHIVRRVIGDSPELLLDSEVAPLQKDVESFDVLKWVFPCFSNWAQPVMKMSLRVMFSGCVTFDPRLGLSEWRSWLASILGSETINAWPLNMLTVSPFTELLSG